MNPLDSGWRSEVRRERLEIAARLLVAREKTAQILFRPLDDQRLYCREALQLADLLLDEADK